MKIDLHEYLATGSRRITPAHLDTLVRQLPEIRLAVTQVEGFPHLADQVDLLAELIEDFAAGLIRNIPFTAVAEAAFALAYLRRNVDLIPDALPAGHADDAALVHAVFENYKEAFLRHVIAKRKG